ncbi:uncharacterized protein STEHIDRAFT_118114 [Stereum hirsutum FP-91666 SS1]|uniref:uncharacterized protein n=1 Tax=Stereum hirsutum (strain FP-91666) TaxID=721885 RepID=UPI0004409EF1|nr:uncharacterized protein STEHIDRAFT_118114 [Stereum hirsutum FP-91666 SS1]EIM90894.1 hypothetical protein STEHIDRAFT_118114 [Stereum hirsutum FP-91666 SS1]
MHRTRKKPESLKASTSSKPTAGRTKNKPELHETSTLRTTASITPNIARTRDKLELRAAPLTKPITARTRNKPKIGPNDTSVSKKDEDHSYQETDFQGGQNKGKSSSKIQQQAEEVVLATRTSGDGHNLRCRRSPYHKYLSS